MASGAADPGERSASVRILTVGAGEIAAGLGLAAVAAFTLVIPLLAVSPPGGHFAGSDGPFVADQLQYISWIRDEGLHALASNRLDLAPSAHVFLHPMFAISGLLWRLGLDIRLAYIAWTPVALATLLCGFALYVQRLVRGRPAQAAALALALFAVSPTAAFLSWTNHAASAATIAAGEMSPAFHLWGYLPTALAVGLMPLVLLGCERLVVGGMRGRGRALTIAAAALVSWLHPWQGETLLLILGGLLLWAHGRGLRALALPMAALAGPLGYYALLGATDGAWHLASAFDTAQHFSTLGTLAAVVPLLLLALPGVRRPGADFQERALVAWVVAALALVYLVRPPFVVHALEGISLPLAILGVRGFQRVTTRFGAPAAGVAVTALVAIVLLTLPGDLVLGQGYLSLVRAGDQAFVLTADEERALHYLDTAPQQGGVLSRQYLGATVPAFTNRATWVGHPTWTPDYPARVRVAEELFTTTDPGRPSEIVGNSGAAFVLADCRAPTRNLAVLTALSAEVARFGCAYVFRVDPGRVGHAPRVPNG